MRAAVIDLSSGDDTTGHPVVNVILADPATDAAPAGYLLIVDDRGVDGGGAWLWTAARGLFTTIELQAASTADTVSTGT